MRLRRTARRSRVVHHHRISQGRHRRDVRRHHLGAHLRRQGLIQPPGLTQRHRSTGSVTASGSKSEG